jgi:hypothetical protein
MHRILIVLFLFTYSLAGHTWNATGHKLIAQIAYDNLSPEAKKMCSRIFKVHPEDLQIYFINISTWMDDIRKKNIHQFDNLHYIDLAFSKDKTKLPPVNQRNALGAIKEAILVLYSSTTNNTTKALNLKILIHVIGDIHQPLHTATKVSRRFPKGDLGGNLYTLKSPYATNLHKYWDMGAGTLTKGSLAVVKFKAYLLEKKWPCTNIEKFEKPEDWINASHNLAVTQAYAIRTHNKPSKNYRYNTIRIVDQQIAYAGCRLANVLNNIAESAK